MRVLILTTQYLPHIGGSEIAIANLTRRLPAVSFDIVSARFGGKWLFPLIGFFRCVFKKYDVIHAWQASYAGGAGWLLKICSPRTPFIVTLQEGKNLQEQFFLVRFFRYVILQKADVITAISSYLLAFAKKTNSRASLVLLPNGVEVAKFAVRGEKKFDLISVSRLVPKNGVDIILRALVLLPTAKLLLVGGGEDRKKLERMASELGISERVTFSGPISNDELPKYLASARIFVRPSRSEGLGISFLEAMAAGLPIVATPVGGIPDFLKDRITGMFCRLDDPGSVADAVQTLSKDPALYQRIVDNALRTVQEVYDWDSLTKKYYETLRHHSGI